jgi:hypothetical protein
MGSRPPRSFPSARSGASAKSTPTAPQPACRASHAADASRPTPGTRTRASGSSLPGGAAARVPAVADAAAAAAAASAATAAAASRANADTCGHHFISVGDAPSSVNTSPPLLYKSFHHSMRSWRSSHAARSASDTRTGGRVLDEPLRRPRSACAPQPRDTNCNRPHALDNRWINIYMQKMPPSFHNRRRRRIMMIIIGLRRR